MNYIPFCRLLRSESSVRVEIKDKKNPKFQTDQASMSKLINHAKADQSIANMNALEAKLLRLRDAKATREQIINELLYYTAERRAIASSIQRQI